MFGFLGLFWLVGVLVLSSLLELEGLEGPEMGEEWSWVRNYVLKC